MLFIISSGSVCIIGGRFWGWVGGSRKKRLLAVSACIYGRPLFCSRNNHSHAHAGLTAYRRDGSPYSRPKMFPVCQAEDEESQVERSCLRVEKHNQISGGLVDHDCLLSSVPVAKCSVAEISRYYIITGTLYLHPWPSSLRVPVPAVDLTRCPENVPGLP